MSHDVTRIRRITEQAQLVADMGRRIVAELTAAPALELPVKTRRVADFSAKLTARARRMLALVDTLDGRADASPSDVATDGAPAPASRHTPTKARTWPRPTPVVTPPQGGAACD